MIHHFLALFSFANQDFVDLILICVDLSGACTWMLNGESSYPNWWLESVTLFLNMPLIFVWKKLICSCWMDYLRRNEVGDRDVSWSVGNCNFSNRARDKSGCVVEHDLKPTMYTSKLLYFGKLQEWVIYSRLFKYSVSNYKSMNIKKFYIQGFLSFLDLSKCSTKWNNMLHLFWFDGWLFLYLWISEFSEAFLFFIIILTLL